VTIPGEPLNGRNPQPARCSRSPAVPETFARRRATSTSSPAITRSRCPRQGSDRRPRRFTASRDARYGELSRPVRKTAGALRPGHSAATPRCSSSTSPTVGLGRPRSAAREMWEQIRPLPGGAAGAILLTHALPCGKRTPLAGPHHRHRTKGGASSPTAPPTPSSSAAGRQNAVRCVTAHSYRRRPAPWTGCRPACKPVKPEAPGTGRDETTRSLSRDRHQRQRRRRPPRLVTGRSLAQVPLEVTGAQTRGRFPGDDNALKSCPLSVVRCP